MLKHIGKHNERNVAILYRMVPNEDHMCLLVYSDLLPRIVHDAVMSGLESAIGQQADNLAEALFRQLMPDGRNVLEVIHKEGFMKKVATSQVIMTPTQQSKIRLDELNNLLSEMAKGEEAIAKLKEHDEQSGLQKKKRDNTKPEQREVGEPARPAMPPLQASDNGVLSDDAIANQQRLQAMRMKNDAKSLLAEAERLEAEAEAMAPTVKVTAIVAQPEKRKPGRPRGSAKNDTTKETKKAKV